MVMLMVAVLAGIAASLLLITTSRYETTYQSASWQESIIGAESGVDLAMNELRKRVTQGPSAVVPAQLDDQERFAGAAYPDYGHAFPATGSRAYTLATHLGEGNTTVQARVYVDVPGAGSSPLSNFAIPPAECGGVLPLATGQPEPARRRRRGPLQLVVSHPLGGDHRPERSDPARHRRARQPVAPPELFHRLAHGPGRARPADVSRMVEVLVKPITGFRNALMADQWINLNDQNVLVDSYDSSKGIYSATSNHGNMGNIATNGQLINANHAQVDGGAATNDGSVKGAENVTGQQSSNFYQELTPYTAGMLSPVWSSTPDGGTLAANATYVASTDPGNPTRVRLDGINLPDGNHTIHLAAPPTPRPPRPLSRAARRAARHARHDGLLPQAVHRRRHDHQWHQRHRGGQRGQRHHLHHRQRQPERRRPGQRLAGRQPRAHQRHPASGQPGRHAAQPHHHVSTDQDFEGVIYAPNHDVDLNMVAAVVAGGPASPPGPPAPAGGPAKPTPPTPPSGGPVHAPPAPPTPAQQADHSAGYNGIYGAFVGNTITVEAIDARPLRPDLAAGRTGRPLRDRQLDRGQPEPRHVRGGGTVLVANPRQLERGSESVWEMIPPPSNQGRAGSPSQPWLPRAGRAGITRLPSESGRFGWLGEPALP